MLQPRGETGDVGGYAALKGGSFVLLCLCRHQFTRRAMLLLRKSSESKTFFAALSREGFSDEP